MPHNFCTYIELLKLYFSDLEKQSDAKALNLGLFTLLFLGPVLLPNMFKKPFSLWMPGKFCPKYSKGILNFATVNLNATDDD